MFTVKVYEPNGSKEKNKLVAVHKYPNRWEADAAAFALRNFPRSQCVIVGYDYVRFSDPMLLFGYKTVVG